MTFIHNRDGEELFHFTSADPQFKCRLDFLDLLTIETSMSASFSLKSEKEFLSDIRELMVIWPTSPTDVASRLTIFSCGTATTLWLLISMIL